MKLVRSEEVVNMQIIKIIFHDQNKGWVNTEWQPQAVIDVGYNKSSNKNQGQKLLNQINHGLNQQ